MCETCRKSLKRSIYIQKTKTRLRKCRRYVNREHVTRQVQYRIRGEHVSSALQQCREISSTFVSGSVCRRDAKSNNLQESHPSKHFGCLNLSLQFLRSADSLRRMSLHRSQFFIFQWEMFFFTISLILSANFRRENKLSVIITAL